MSSNPPPLFHEVDMHSTEPAIAIAPKAKDWRHTHQFFKSRMSVVGDRLSQVCDARQLNQSTAGRARALGAVRLRARGFWAAVRGRSFRGAENWKVNGRGFESVIDFFSHNCSIKLTRSRARRIHLYYLRGLKSLKIRRTAFYCRGKSNYQH